MIGGDGRKVIIERMVHMRNRNWKHTIALLAASIVAAQMGTAGMVSYAEEETTATTPTTQTETTTTTIHIDYATKVEYDNSPLAVGETRAVRFYHPGTNSASGADIGEVSDNISYTYDEGSDTIYITALAAGDAKMYIRESDCAFGAYVNLAITEATTTTTQTETTTTTAVFCYATKVEYDNSPLAVGETRAVRFYHPETNSASGADIGEVSDNISYTYDEGSDTIYITALAAGDAKMYIRESDCAFGAYVNLTVTEAKQKLTLDDVVTLAQKGEALTWSDFESYAGQDIGSGIHLMQYKIDDTYTLKVGGGHLDVPPEFITLESADGRSIDIRTEDVSAFLNPAPAETTVPETEPTTAPETSTTTQTEAPTTTTVTTTASATTTAATTTAAKGGSTSSPKTGEGGYLEMLSLVTALVTVTGTASVLHRKKKD